MPPGNENCVNSRFMPCFVLRDVRIDLAVGAFQVGVGHQARPAVAGPGDVDHVQVVLLDDPVQVDVDEVQARRGAPVAQQPRLDVLAASAAPSAAGCRRGRSGRRTGSWPPASRRPSCATVRAKAADPSRGLPLVDEDRCTGHYQDNYSKRDCRRKSDRQKWARREGGQRVLMPLRDGKLHRSDWICLYHVMNRADGLQPVCLPWKRVISFQFLLMPSFSRTGFSPRMDQGGID